MVTLVHSQAWLPRSFVRHTVGGAMNVLTYTYIVRMTLSVDEMSDQHAKIEHRIYESQANT